VWVKCRTCPDGYGHKTPGQSVIHRSGISVDELGCSMKVPSARPDDRGTTGA